MTPEHIIHAICEVTQVSREDFDGRCRQRHIVLARQMAWKMCRVAIDMNERQTSLYFHRHNAVIHSGIDHIDSVMHRSEKVKQNYERAWDLAWSMALEKAA